MSEMTAELFRPKGPEGRFNYKTHPPRLSTEWRKSPTFRPNWACSVGKTNDGEEGETKKKRGHRGDRFKFFQTTSFNVVPKAVQRKVFFKQKKDALGDEPYRAN